MALGVRKTSLWVGDIEAAELDSSRNIGSQGPDLDAYFCGKLDEAVECLELGSTLGNAQLREGRAKALDSRHAATETGDVGNDEIGGVDDIALSAWGLKIIVVD